MAVATSTALAWAAAAAAAGASAYNSRQTAKKQDNALAASIRGQQDVQKKADAKIAQELNALEGSNARDEAATTLETYQQALQGSDKQASAGQALEGLSGEYDAATNQSKQGSKEYIQDIAGLLSRMDAAGLQRQGEGYRIGDLGTNLSVFSREAGGLDQLGRMKAAAVRRNPWIDAASAALSAYAGGATGGSTAGQAAGSAAGSAGNWSGPR